MQQIIAVVFNFVIIAFSGALTATSIVGQYTFTLNESTKPAELWILTSVILVLSTYSVIRQLRDMK